MMSEKIKQLWLKECELVFNDQYLVKPFMRIIKIKSYDHYDFYNDLLKRADRYLNLHSNIKYISETNGIHRSWRDVTFGYCATKNESWVELNINAKDNIDKTIKIYNYIKKHRFKIRNLKNAPNIDWEAEKKELFNSRIILSYSKYGGIESHHEKDKIHDDLIRKMIFFFKNFSLILLKYENEHS